MGLFLDELEPGMSWDLGTYAFTAENIVAFAKKYDPQYFHLDAEAAKAGPFGKLSASGWHTASAWMKCYIAANQAAEAALRAEGRMPATTAPSPGFSNLKWLKPVCPGDVIRYRTTVTGKRELATRPGWGLLFSYNEGVNQAGELVFCFDGKVFVPMKSGTDG
ncbi:MAG: MaoC family dehydratase [Alphaproteobacteria bacterium]|nr:MaoC family dehydratase [Alphaproteobacteria bacterium]